jgi:hypothetical protein
VAFAQSDCIGYQRRQDGPQTVYFYRSPDVFQLESVQTAHVPDGFVDHTRRPFRARELRGNTLPLVPAQHQETLDQITIDCALDWRKVAAERQVVSPRQRLVVRAELQLQLLEHFLLTPALEGDERAERAL